MVDIGVFGNIPGDLGALGGVLPFLIVNLIFLYIGRAAGYILRIQAIDSSLYIVAQQTWDSER